ncbi:MAG: 3-isopropylmalate dehydratase small subunit [Amylibacter sp.]|nr:3-isopropylmalate dehydratase small subunit [Amylibacter sp.]|tara:strand:- start:1625 stop:2224 length:600 start_codon:yes stop_codon:yes gene_type:complete
MTKIIKGLAAPLPLANVDTDVIMPKRFLRTITREGLVDGVFADLRFYGDDKLREDFVLNQVPWKTANILVVGDNFGCGSSREHAVWGLRQLGIDAIIGTSFAGIFFDNARKNGLALPIVTPEQRDLLLEVSKAGKMFQVSVVDKTIYTDGEEIHFSMDDATQTALLYGRDDTLDSLKKCEDINAFEATMVLKEKVSVIK